MKNNEIEIYQKDDIYLHKLLNYKDLFDFVFNGLDVFSICEIGIESGDFRLVLSDYMLRGQIKEYHGVDISNISNKMKDNAYYYEMTSLEYLNSTSHIGHDVYLIDGDHNYYTVTNELNAIFSAKNGKKICFLHDTNWPCARRDFYYSPDLIPEDSRNEFSWDKKIVRSSEDNQEFGFFGNGAFAMSINQNTPKNGVMTAIEDFVSDKKHFKIINFPQFLGLTILYNENLLLEDEKHFFASIKSAMSYPFIYNGLAQIEMNRLDIYTKLLVLEQKNLVAENQKIIEISNQNVCLQREIKDLKFHFKRCFVEEAGTTHLLIAEMEQAYRNSCVDSRFNAFVKNKVNYIKFHHATLFKKIEKQRKLSDLASFKNKISAYDVVSFDFFDTLVIRSVEPPERVKNKIAEITCDILTGVLKRKIDCYYYSELRSFYEDKLRTDSNLLLGKDHETSLEQILTKVLQHFCINNAALLDELLKLELDLERDVLKENEGALELLEFIKRQGKRVIVISDMYLSKKALINIAENLNMNQYIDDFYVSGDIGYAKYSGNLFRVALDNEKVTAEQIVHIGDNFHSDYVSPKYMGIASFWLHQKSNLIRRHSVEKKINQHAHSFIKNKITSSFKQQDYSKKHLAAAYFEVIAPALFSMAYKNLKDSIKLNIKNFFFLSREGVSFKLVYDLLISNHPEFKGRNFKTHILYISRTSSACASYTGSLNVDAIITKIYETFGFLSYGNLLKTWGINENNFDHLFVERPAINSNADIFELFKNESFADEFDNILIQNRKNLYGYLSQEGVFTEASFLVDIGWGGTIFKNIQVLNSSAKIFAAYLGTDTRFGLNSMKGYLFNTYDKRTKIIVRSAAILEELLSFNSISTVLSYYAIDEVFHLQFLDKKNEHSEIELLRRDVFMSFEKVFSELTREYCFNADELISYSKEELYQLVTRPSREFISDIEDLKFSLGWGNEEKNNLIGKINKRIMLRPKLFYFKMKSMHWLFGTMKRSGIGWLNPIICYFLLLDANVLRALKILLKRIKGKILK